MVHCVRQRRPHYFELGKDQKVALAAACAAHSARLGRAITDEARNRRACQLISLGVYSVLASVDWHT